MVIGVSAAGLCEDRGGGGVGPWSAAEEELTRRGARLPPGGVVEIVMQPRRSHTPVGQLGHPCRQTARSAPSRPSRPTGRREGGRHLPGETFERCGVSARESEGDVLDACLGQVSEVGDEIVRGADEAGPPVWCTPWRGRIAELGPAARAGAGPASRSGAPPRKRSSRR